jgi:hypothetical protein
MTVNVDPVLEILCQVTVCYVSDVLEELTASLLSIALGRERVFWSLGIVMFLI